MRIQKKMRGAALLAVAVLLANIVAPLASAAEPAPAGPFNFTVSPPSAAIEAIPGVPTSLDVRVQNQNNVAEKVVVTLMKFTAEGETGVPKLQDITPNDDFAKWAKISPTTFTAEPNEWKTVKISIAPPKDAAFGYYYALVFSRQGAAQQQQGKAKSSLLGALASLVLLDVKAPGAVRKVEIAEFSTTSRSFEFLPASFNVRMQNKGNTHVGVNGTVTISRHGQYIGQVDVNASKGYILPGSFRNFVTKWSDGSPVYKGEKDSQGNPVLNSDGIQQQQLSWDNFSPSKLRFGKYDARLVMIYNDGQGDVSTEAKLSFWVIPWRIIGVFAVAGLLVLAGLWVLIGKPLRDRLRKPRHHGDSRRF